MKPLATFASGIILAALIDLPVLAQPTTPLAYVQPLPPAAVQAVQQHLRHAGAYGGNVDGVWGPDSAAALQRFQASHQLQATGQMNQATAEALGLDTTRLLGTQEAQVPPLPSPETLQASSVRAIQERLRSLGFYTGGVDGVWGQSTQSAIQQFQQNRGLQPNGQLNQATVSAMGLPPNALAYR
ncbi:MAG TPA: peptidoglycan-binding domain-containing protein [Rhodopila sp.]|nr:peptidoglycan-binding domain-containing protein [Rhodopila sp.]